jgi:ubiquinone/menaquinone biosynthesis C-methylase UbiE
VAFAPFVREVTALDPESDMLEIARNNASEGHFNIKLVRGSSFDLGPQLGRFQAATIGRAFHWMDRVATLNLLDTMIESDGVVVLFNDSHPETSGALICPSQSFLPEKRCICLFNDGDWQFIYLQDRISSP